MSTHRRLDSISLRGGYSLQVDCGFLQGETPFYDFFSCGYSMYREIYRAVYDKRCGALDKLISLVLSV